MYKMIIRSAILRNILRKTIRSKFTLHCNNATLNLEEKTIQERKYHGSRKLECRVTSKEISDQVAPMKPSTAAETLKAISKYTIEKTSGKGDIHDLKYALKGSFFLDEPSISMLGLNGSEQGGELINVMMEGIDFNESVVARDMCSNSIVGYALMGPFNQSSLQSDLDRWLCKMKDSRNRKLLELWKAISMQFDYNDVCKGRCVELYYLGVLPRARGQGLGKKLVESSVNIARKCGYDIMQVVCTSSTSAYICKSLNMKHHVTVSYDNLSLQDGRRILSSSPPSPNQHVHVYFQLL